MKRWPNLLCSVLNKDAAVNNSTNRQIKVMGREYLKVVQGCEIRSAFFFKLLVHLHCWINNGCFPEPKSEVQSLKSVDVSESRVPLSARPFYGSAV